MCVGWVARCSDAEIVRLKKLLLKRYQQELKNMGKWDECEFMNPSLNAFYRIPCGMNSCYCDQAFVIMESLAAEGCVDPDDIDERFEEFCAEGGTGGYGSLNRDALTTGLVAAMAEDA